MNEIKTTAIEDAEAFLATAPAMALCLNNLNGGAIIRRLVDDAKRHASRANTAMRRVVELEAEVVRLTEAQRAS